MASLISEKSAYWQAQTLRHPVRSTSMSANMGSEPTLRPVVFAMLVTQDLVENAARGRCNLTSDETGSSDAAVADSLQVLAPAVHPVANHFR
jgi:hypothetical protein